MSKTNILISLNSYEDAASSNNPNLNHFKWTRQVITGDSSEPQSIQTLVPFGVQSTLFSSTYNTDQDSTTEYQLAYQSGNLYSLEAIGGTLPNFRYDTGLIASSDVVMDVSVSGSAVTFTQVSGTPIVTTNLMVGDEVKISNNFNSLNQGSFRLLAFTANSVTISNPSGVAETGVDATDSILIQSIAGVQAGDSIFLPAAFGAGATGIYQVVNVFPNQLIIASNKTLPPVTVVAEIVSFTKPKKLVYIESSKPVKLTINGSSTILLEPAFLNCPALTLLQQKVFSLSVEATEADGSMIYMASVE